MVAEAAAELDRIPLPARDTTEVLGIRMVVLHEQKNWTALATLAESFVQRAPQEAAAWITWAYATRRCHTLEAAEPILREAEQKHPTEATIQFNLGCYACVRGDLVEAQRRVDRAISLDPKFTEAAATDPDLQGLRDAAKQKM